LRRVDHSTRGVLPSVVYQSVIMIPVAARSKACVCGRLLAGIGGFQSRRVLGFLSLVSVVCFQVEVFASG
jgi:hypothetical protein